MMYHPINEHSDYPYNYKIELVIPAVSAKASSEITTNLHMEPLAKSKDNFKKACLNLQTVHIKSDSVITGSPAPADDVFYLVVDYSFSNTFKFTKGTYDSQKSKILGIVRTYPGAQNFVYQCLSAHAERLFLEEIPDNYSLTFRLTDFSGATIPDGNVYLTNANVRIILNLDLY